MPWSLATPDGQLRKTMKSVLLSQLEKDLEPLSTVPDQVVFVIDMALLQSIPSPHNTFGELAEVVFGDINFGKLSAAN